MSLSRTLVNNFEVWGNQQMDLTTGDTTEWDVGVSQWTDDEAKRIAASSAACVTRCPLLSRRKGTPRRIGIVLMLARCSAASSHPRARGGGGGFATAVVPCIGFTVGWGPCVVGAATGVFVRRIIYEGYDAGTTCGRGHGRSSVGRPAPERLPRIHTRS